MTKDNQDDLKKPPSSGSTKLEPVSFLSLFRYSTLGDRLLIWAGVVLASASGIAIPAVTMAIGEILDIFVDYESQFTRLNTTYNVLNGSIELEITTEQFLASAYGMGWMIGATSIGYFLCAYLFVYFLSKAASRQIYRIKIRFYESLLRQEISWYDDKSSGDYASRLTNDLKKVEDGIGEKIGFFVYMISTSFITVIFSFFYGWELTLVLLAFSPLIAVASGLMAKVQGSSARKEVEAYAKAGAVAQEVMSLIKTVFAFSGEAKEMERYEKSLLPAKKSGIRRNVATGLALGFMWFCMYCAYVPGIWYGAKLLIESRESNSFRYTGGTLVIIMWNTMCLGYFFGQATPYIEAFQMAKG